MTRLTITEELEGLVAATLLKQLTGKSVDVETFKHKMIKDLVNKLNKNTNDPDTAILKRLAGQL